MLPAQNLRGIRGGAVGATASNTIPTDATASIDFRLVPRQTPEHIKQLVETHVKGRGYFIVDHSPTAADRRRANGARPPPLPMYTFESVLHAPLIVLPVVNHDNNQHAANENLRMKNLFDGIDVYAGVMAKVGEYWR